MGHAGEILQGALWRATQLEPFLVTLPAPVFRSRASFCTTNEPADEVQPAWKSKALQAALAAWSHLGGGDASTRLVIESQTPVGIGCGSSTSDCVAAIRAVADYLGRECLAEDVARWCAEAELASDGTMFERETVAVRPRRGEVLHRLGGCLPPMRVVAVDLGGPAVDSVGRPMPAYSAAEVYEFEQLLHGLETGIAKKDARIVAQVATRSATLHQRHYPLPRWEEFVAMAERCGALGVGCSHSGSLATILLPANADAVVEAFPVLARYSLGVGW